MARESAKLNANRSIVSILVFVFIIGKRTKLSMYPGINNRKGRPRMIRMIPSISIKIIGNRIILHIRQIKTSIGGLIKTIFMFSPEFYVDIMLIISFDNIKINTTMNPLMIKFIFFLR